MKTTTSNPKTALLLGAALDVLHQESKEWLETIAFWKDETKFFADLLNKNKEQASEYGKMLKNLDKIHENLFDYLEDDIMEHEKLLSRLYKDEKGLSDWDYREKHRSLGERINLFTNDFREFKKMVFGYAKKF
ncbi:hypothetical protein [Maribacter sp.]|uniref:hypothetical protein n=1 Tax=Maribacter sp. TaxID=1897614 RepID=UPI0025B99F92|nr:hypothetical protein [Maribacter sp.]